MQIDPFLRAIDVTTEAIKSRPSAHWVLGFSGGKDSSAALKIFIAAYKRAKSYSSRVTIIYCDTGVENPILDAYSKNLIHFLADEFLKSNFPFTTKIIKAPIQDRFFVRIIGRGYPPPTNNFRWCTTSLRINPVSRFIESLDPNDTVVVLGLRKSESGQRDRSLSKSDDLYWQKQREGQGQYDMFLPIVELDIPQVWDVIYWLPLPLSLVAHELERLYRGASGECPIIKSPQSAPCSSGRFGCWTCTVVRKDRSSRELIRAGHLELMPFLQFRDWLAEFRNDPANRWPTRRNGSVGLGPFSLQARKVILEKINTLEQDTRTVILDSDERGLIAALWEFDHYPRLRFKDAG